MAYLPKYSGVRQVPVVELALVNKPQVHQLLAVNRSPARKPLRLGSHHCLLGTWVVAGALMRIPMETTHLSAVCWPGKLGHHWMARCIL